MINLRPNQTEWIGAISAAFARRNRRVLAQAPTGFGKTVCFAEIVRRTVARGNRVVIVAHRIEIINQIAFALRRAGVAFGWIESGRLMMNEMVQIGMVVTVASRLDKMREPNLLVIDEAHHAVAGSYRKIAERWPAAFVLGVTATPQRLDGRTLRDSFDALVPGPSVRELINRGYLSSFTYYSRPALPDLSGVRTRAGDYAQDEIAALMDRSSVTGDAVETYRKHLNGRPAIAFCVSVEHAKHVAHQFAAAGWRADSVDGATGPVMRKDRIAAIGDGRLQVLTSCDIISEGTDIPAVAGAILLRPTKSLTIFVQQVGRVLRVKPDLSGAIILDHVGNVFTHGMPDAEREWTLEGREKRSRAVSVRQCPKCYAAFLPAPKCPECGHLFPVSARRHAPEQRDGSVVEITAGTFDTRAQRLATAPLKELIREAKTLEQLREIGAARGFHAGWARRMHNFKLGKRTNAFLRANAHRQTGASA